MRKRTTLAFCVAAALFNSVQAAEPPSSPPVEKRITLTDPVQMVEQTTETLLGLADEAKDYVAEDPERYYQQVASLLERVFDVDYFARGVMGTYGSGRMYKSLKSDDERAAFRRRTERFAEILKESFIMTYADALLTFDGIEVTLDEPPPPQDERERTLSQTIVNKDNQTYRVVYRLHKNREEKWQVYNVIVEGVNMGATFRSQFAQAVEDHRGDVDFVVNNWSRIMKNPEDVADNTHHPRQQ